MNTKNKIINKTGTNIFGMFKYLLYSINSSVYFSGIMMILLNIGSKYISISLSKNQEQLLKNKIMRQILIFSIVWTGTKDIITSFALTAIFIILADYLFNEESSLCVIPDYMERLNKVMDLNNDNKISDEEIKHALKVLETAKINKHKSQQLQLIEMFENNNSM